MIARLLFHTSNQVLLFQTYRNTFFDIIIAHKKNLFLPPFLLELSLVYVYSNHPYMLKYFGTHWRSPASKAKHAGE